MEIIFVLRHRENLMKEVLVVCIIDGCSSRLPLSEADNAS